MEVIDLSHTIHDKIQIYPGDPLPSIKRGLTHEKDYCHVDVLTLGSHTGTHIDAPFHFLEGGKKIDEIPVRKFVGNGVLVDVSGKSDRELIEPDDVEPYRTKINTGDFVIFKTGRDKFFGTSKYYLHPYMSAECARLLLNMGVILVGIDAMNIDPTYQKVTDLEAPVKDLPDENEYGYPVHDILLGNDILIVENLSNLDEISQIKGIYSFLPLKLKGSDGSPIRAVFMGT
ncbi:Metal-dependent hydrolase [Olavius sp. associated proteobacterium Delta 1]|nr:Metal-dependent hydrolase [Olavius sp. associated proteobacterium Delta 1]